MSRTLLLAVLAIAPIATPLQQPPVSPQTATLPPDTEIFLAPFSARGATLVGRATNMTNSPGYDNQPSFTPDGRSIVFTSIRGGGTQTDIYRYDIAPGTVTRVTNTPEGEYSPTVTPDGAHISVVRVEADSTQRLWRFALDGTQPELVLAGVRPVGYHAWADDHTLALFVLGQPATLRVADTRTGQSEVLVGGIGRSIQRIPATANVRGTISFVEREAMRDGSATLWIRALDPRKRWVTTLVAAVAGARDADCAWTPDGMLLMAEKDVLYGWRRGNPSTGSGRALSTGSGRAPWRRLADLGALGLHGVTRIAISPKGDRIAFVTQGTQP